MEPQMNQEISQGVGQVVPSTTTNTSVDKKQNGTKYGMIACATLAVIGIGFGIYGMIRKPEESPVQNAAANAETEAELANLKQKYSVLQTYVKELEASGTEIPEETRSAANTETAPKIKNAIVAARNNDEIVKYYPFGATRLKLGASSDKLNIAIKDGSIDLCEIYLDGSDENKEECTMGGFSGRIADVTEALYGNGFGGESLLFLMEDGSVEYIPVLKASNEKNFNSRGKVPINGSAVRFQRLYMTALENGHFMSGYADTAIILYDGSIIRYSDIKDQLDI